MLNPVAFLSDLISLCFSASLILPLNCAFLDETSNSLEGGKWTSNVKYKE